MGDSHFKDHFSGHAQQYADARPTYPAALFTHLSSLVPADAVVWDCATGNGQAAVALARHFAAVIATDGSAAQISSSAPADNIEYRVAPAENSGLANDSVQLVTVAQALHWFDFVRFFAEVDRVLQRGGVLAVWAYELFEVTPEIDSLIHHLYHNVLHDYWPDERRHVERGYADIPFPYPLVKTPAFKMEVDWSVQQIAAYLSSWSAVQRYQKATGVDPVAALYAELSSCARPRNRVVWPMTIKIGRKP